MKFFTIFVFVCFLFSTNALATGGLSPESNLTGGSAPQASSNLHPQSLHDYVYSQVSGDYVNHYNNGFQSVCKSYSHLSANQKKEVIAIFVTAIAKAESGLNSFSRFRESFGVWSIGLFQTSYEDKTPYDCPYNYSADSQKAAVNKSIYRSDTQVQCFVKISTKLFSQPQNFPYLRKIAKQKSKQVSQLSPMEKLSAYWSIFRPSNRAGYTRFNNHLKSHLPPSCN